MSPSAIDPAATALLVIEMQNDFVEEGAPLGSPEGRRIPPTLQKVLDAAGAAGMPVSHPAHVHRRGGADMGIHRDLYPPVGAGQAADEHRAALRIMSLTSSRVTDAATFPAELS